MVLNLECLTSIIKKKDIKFEYLSCESDNFS